MPLVQDQATSPLFPLPPPLSPSPSPWPRADLGANWAGSEDANCPARSRQAVARGAQVGQPQRCCCVVTCSQPQCQLANCNGAPRVVISKKPSSNYYQFERTDFIRTVPTANGQQPYSTPSSSATCPKCPCPSSCTMSTPLPMTAMGTLTAHQSVNLTANNRTSYTVSLGSSNGHISPSDDDLDQDKGHGCFRRSVPSMPMCIAVLLCVLNCILPGLGTFLASMTIPLGCKTEYGRDKWTRAFIICLITAIIQTATALFVLGWVWSIMWGINFVKHSAREQERTLYKNYNNNHL
ncbi:Protein stum -like protein [Halotydeus destructor]|nr:Protein stum -like protein [Halotydeus destructor]